MRFVLAILAVGSAIGCAAAPSPVPRPLEVYPNSEPDRRAALDRAWDDLAADPDDLDKLIWYGRRTAYLGAYERAIEIYSAGLERAPRHPELLRHRGHRWLTVGDFAAAERDLEAAARVVRGQADVVEADGLPNARGTPTSTLHTNVWYHLGLARYFQRDFDGARDAFTTCLAKSQNRDMEVAARYWLFLSRRRIGDDGASVLEPVRADWDIVENESYHRLLLLFRGDLALGVVARPEGDAVVSATLGYGLARYELEHGAAAQAWARLAELARGGPPAAFGCIAARVDLAHASMDR